MKTKLVIITVLHKFNCMIASVTSHPAKIAPSLVFGMKLENIVHIPITPITYTPIPAYDDEKDEE